MIGIYLLYNYNLVIATTWNMLIYNAIRDTVWMFIILISETRKWSNCMRFSSVLYDILPNYIIIINYLDTLSLLSCFCFKVINL